MLFLNQIHVFKHDNGLNDPINDICNHSMVIMMIHLYEYISYSVDKKHNHESLMIETKNHAKM